MAAPSQSARLQRQEGGGSMSTGHVQLRPGRRGRGLTDMDDAQVQLGPAKWLNGPEEGGGEGAGWRSGGSVAWPLEEGQTAGTVESDPR